MHKTVVCKCGVQISTCRCPAPKQTVVSDKPCTHVKSEVPEAVIPDYLVEVNEKWAPVFGMTADEFGPLAEQYLAERLALMWEGLKEKMSKN